ncbi:aldo/keto reductase [Pontibacter sp. BT310]|uniref:Aldo/keto reductase n=1 Tax=Pontibacter populi TaxID=890055 RepID=A0ABS6XAW9_9BACT|nr:MULTISPECIES: aldo/keto reductase [Pontibacter]MBJ6118204.1 aldo/keto reductase [Pontibacter sp. BT310]MBR0570631.1 aldo/keto reductase [Microvirga sp. STS03]MBW3365057.1 aldo/keto reductase [Pontibacter populi]
MQKRRLGNTDLYTSPIVFGGNVLGWTLNEKESFAILDEFVDLGFNTIDTADAYSTWAEGNQGGESETIIGKWMKARGNQEAVTVITKVGSDMGQGHKDISEKYILKAAEDSLKRLQVEQIYLYLTHWDDDKTPVEETLGAYQKLIEAGKVKYIGASNLSPERLKASLEASKKHGLPRYEVFQPEYNLYNRQAFEEGVGKICKAEGLGVITYYSLSSGFLTGKYRTEADFGKSVRGGSMQKYLNERGKRILAALDTIADKHSISQAGVALAWLVNNPDVTAPIASATKSKHLQAFAEATQVNLTQEDMKLLDQESS